MNATIIGSCININGPNNIFIFGIIVGVMLGLAIAWGVFRQR